MVAEQIDIIVIGCGAAGLRAAIATATAGTRCLILGQSTGATAQATADFTLCGNDMQSFGYFGFDETPAQLAQEIIRSSFYLANPEKAQKYSTEAANAFSELLSWGLSRPHQIGPRDLLIQGHAISNILLSRCRELGIEILFGWNAIGLLTNVQGIAGVIASDSHSNIRQIHSRSVILATGGYHGICGPTSNSKMPPAVSHVWAVRAGAALADMEMINHCPFAISKGRYKGSILPYLLSHIAELALLDDSGNEVAVLPHAGSKPRTDVGEWDKLLGWLILARLKPTSSGQCAPRFFIRILRVDQKKLETFSVIFSNWRINNRDQGDLLRQLLRGDPTQVTWVPHYSCGGIVTNVNGATKVPGLFACGECAAGTFGAFRTVSSITDCLVFGRLTGMAAAESVIGVANSKRLRTIRAVGPSFSLSTVVRAKGIAAKQLLPLRNKLALPKAIQQLRDLQRSKSNAGPMKGHWGGDQLVTMEACLLAADARRDSRGFHVEVANPVIHPQGNANTIVELSNGELRVELVPNGAVPLTDCHCRYDTFVETSIRRSAAALTGENNP